jgi:adenylate kinase family enzyme
MGELRSVFRRMSSPRRSRSHVARRLQQPGAGDRSLRDPPVNRSVSWESTVKRVAVFGNAGGGKSTLARRLAHLTGIPLYPVDMIQYPTADARLPHEQYLKAHAALLQADAWIIDGFGCRKSAWERFSCADTLIYVDLPLYLHFWWVTKRLFKGFYVTPEGWPDGSPMISSTLSSYRVLWQCHAHLTPKYRALVSSACRNKRVYHLKSPADMETFLREVDRQVRLT